jgi:hypothetical protein
VKDNMENEQMAAQLVKLEARVLGLMSVCAAMLKHHPQRGDAETALDQLLELHECALLPSAQPDAVASVIRSTACKVLQLANALPAHDGATGHKPC